jgi:hypothetical protein
MNSIIKALNLTDGAVLTLEKLPDRMEFEALVSMVSSIDKGNNTCPHDICLIDLTCGNCNDTCDCVGPTGYINCRPFTVCPSNNCRPVT